MIARAGRLGRVAAAVAVALVAAACEPRGKRYRTQPSRRATGEARPAAKAHPRHEHAHPHPHGGGGHHHHPHPHPHLEGPDGHHHPY